MSGGLFRTFHFGAELGAPDEARGLRIAPGGRLGMVAGTESIRQAITLLLATRRGERVMRPEYGCDLHRLIFSPNDSTTAGLSMHYVRQALERWEPRIEIVDLDAEAHPEQAETLLLWLEYRVRPGLLRDQLEIAVDLGGGAA